MNFPVPSKELREEVLGLKFYLRKTLWMSFFCSVLSLTPSIYMLDVYDRVINSRDGLTLLMLTILAVGAYLLMEILEWVRAEVMQKASIRFDENLNQRIFDAIFRVGLQQGRGNAQALSDLRVIREFVSSAAVMAVLDALFSVIFLFIVFLIHPLLGWASVMGALAQVLVTYRTEKKTQPPLTASNRAAIAAQTYAGNTLRNAQVVESMGMLNSIHAKWMVHQQEMLRLQAEASDHAGWSAAVSKFIQNILSSGLLGLGCWLSLSGSLNGGGGMMIVASILGGKVLSPLMQIVAQWKNVVNARDAYARLNNLLSAVPVREMGMPLPRPKGKLDVEAVVAAAPGSQVSILRGINFSLPAGETLVVVGPSASGKTTLARLLMGVWPALAGKVRLDGADVFHWNKEELGPHIGYLPQGIELFDGTLAENIARFGEVDMDKVRAAGALVGLDSFVNTLSEGYESRIGVDGSFLSGGQRQRVGLARAIYGTPSFIVLDEPNSSLDEMGEKALLQTLLTLKSLKSTLVVITHRTNVLSVADRILVLRDGAVQMYGPRDEVLAALSGKPATAPATPNVPAVA
jgi:ATP-binding cassette subfamily C exporter for protease/lipase